MPVRGRRLTGMRSLFQRFVLARVWLTFAMLGVAFLGFGAGTVNLGLLLMANARFLADNGWMAVMDGGLWQLLQLLATGYASMAAYIVFKTCEHRLSHWLGHPPCARSSGPEAAAPVEANAARPE